MTVKSIEQIEEMTTSQLEEEFQKIDTYTRELMMERYNRYKAVKRSRLLEGENKTLFEEVAFIYFKGGWSAAIAYYEEKTGCKLGEGAESLHRLVYGVK